MTENKSSLQPRTENIEVPAHTTQRLTIPAEGGDWTLTSIRSGCIRVQRGDFCAYIPVGRSGMEALQEFVDNHITRTLSAQNRADMHVQEA